MRVRMFMPQFAPLVKSGAKRQTIRPRPKRMPISFDKESWRVWSGRPYRSKQVELAQVEIDFVIPVEISSQGIRRTDMNCALLPRYIARKDGFANWLDMKNWFKETHGLPFTGILIKAKDA